MSTTFATTSDTARGRPVPHRATAAAALVKAATYVVGFVVMGAYLAPRGFVEASASPADALAFVLENQAATYAFYLVLYVVGGFALIGLVVGLHDRMQTSSTQAWLRPARAVGLTWAGLLLASGLVALVGQHAVVGLADADMALATSTWLSVSVVQDALGGGIEVVGAAWVLLVGSVGVRSGHVSRPLSVLGIVAGVVGVTTLVPAAADAAGALFGVAMIVWFTWTGVSLLRHPVEGGQA